MSNLKDDFKEIEISKFAPSEPSFVYLPPGEQHWIKLPKYFLDKKIEELESCGIRKSDILNFDLKKLTASLNDENFISIMKIFPEMMQIMVDSYEKEDELLLNLNKLKKMVLDNKNCK